MAELTDQDRKDLQRIMRKLGSKGGKVGGRARWADLTEEERSEQMKAIASRPRPGARKKAAAKKAKKK